MAPIAIGILNVFRAEEGDWRHGSVYLFIFTTNGYVIFHAADRTREARNRPDINGFKIVQELIASYVEYYYNDPVIGDEDTGSPKRSYAKSFVTRNGREIVVGAGIYLNSATAKRWKDNPGDSSKVAFRH